MPAFEQGAVVRVPFPYTDRDTRQRRPALIVSNGPIGRGDMLLWVAMITSAENARWDDDVALIDDFTDYGLPVASLIRTAKLATIDCSAAISLGKLGQPKLGKVLERIASQLGLD